MDKRIAKFKEQYKTALFSELIPVWEKYGVDRVCGGYLHGYDRHWELYYSDKSVWNQGRMLWWYAKLFNEVEQKPNWLEEARIGYDFINKYCFHTDGHMYFRVTREGKPLQLRRYYFSEGFTIMGYVEYYKATKDEEVKRRAVELYRLMVKYFTTPNYFPPKLIPETRSYKGHAMHMLMLNVSMSVKEIADEPACDEIIARCLDMIVNKFYKREFGVLFETIGKNNEFVDDTEGRLVNPGHAIESAWFMMDEAARRQDKRLMEDAIDIMNGCLKAGWDERYGGLLYFIDIKGKPSPRTEWDMKLLWPQCETLCALIYAYRYTGDVKYLDLFATVSDYLFANFYDREFGGWYGHLHRDNTPLNYAKGGDYRCAYHESRAFYVIYRAFEAIENKTPLFK